MSAVTHVPLLDLNAQYEPIESQVVDAIVEVVRSKQFIMGPQIAVLESQLADYCQARHAIGVSSGTDALVLALMALGIGAGDEVITSPFTFFATAGSIARVGAIPVFVDIDPESFNIDPTLIEAKITNKTKAIMPVHLFGQMADMDPIMALAKKYNLKVIEDSAQSIGAEYKGVDGVSRRSGSIGDIGCFSFFPSKNLGCCGDGGAVSTNNEDLAQMMTTMRVHGGKQRYYHDVVGGNFRLDTIQAAVLLIKLQELESQHEQRIKNGQLYNQLLSGISGIQLPVNKVAGRMIYNQYTLRVQNRDQLVTALNEARIGNAVYYPLPLHLQECFAHLGYKLGDFPHAEAAAKEVLSIPIYSELTLAQQEYVAGVIRNSVNS
jgi:dTDP-4-amino-4,6-dideoxygalactose transaminase